MFTKAFFFSLQKSHPTLIEIHRQNHQIYFSFAIVSLYSSKHSIGKYYSKLIICKECENQRLKKYVDFNGIIKMIEQVTKIFIVVWTEMTNSNIFWFIFLWMIRLNHTLFDVSIGMNSKINPIGMHSIHFAICTRSSLLAVFDCIRNFYFEFTSILICILPITSLNWLYITTENMIKKCKRSKPLLGVHWSKPLLGVLQAYALSYYECLHLK